MSDSLAQYRKKRRFDRTPEPSADTGSGRAKRGLGPGETAAFYVQRHHASHLHYDLRLEIDGTLKSWAVPKGPSLDPEVKRLAVHVEDHPLSYGTFEGTIPKGEYGGGVVKLWDRGRFELLGDASAASQLSRGDLKFRLEGNHLHGEFALVRMKTAKKSEWLLIKKRDRYAVKRWSIDEASDSDAMPRKIAPMLASLATAVPPGEGWAFESKWDGVRALLFKENGKVTLRARSGQSYDKQFPELLQIGEALQADTAILDGEIVAIDESGRSRFQALQPRLGTHFGVEKRSKRANSIRNEHQNALFCAFDVLYFDGTDLRERSLHERKDTLAAIVTKHPLLHVSIHVEGRGKEALAAAEKAGLEGIIAKRLDSKYRSGRSRDWLKIKLHGRQEFVICGWLQGRRKEFRSLVLGLQIEGELRWCGNVGTGFDAKLLRQVRAELDRLKSAKPKHAGKDWPAGMHWVKPELLCEVKFAEWTDDSHLRAPVFLGLRTDKKAEEAVPERADRKVQITHPEKIYFPKDKLRKGDLVAYYEAMAPSILPYLKDRPLSLRRYPGGIRGESFFQKNLPESTPDWLKTITLYSEDSKRDIRYALASDVDSLLYLVNLGCIDHNPWMSRVESLDNADYVLIDLDPNHCEFSKVVEAALHVHEILTAVNLASYAKTSGGHGMHIVAPLGPGHDYDQVRQFTTTLAKLAARQRPDLFTIERAKAKRRKDRVYFDHVQIGKGKTIAAPYCVRPYDGAPVGAPLAWEEVNVSLEPSQHHLRNIEGRLQKKGDLFAPVLKQKQKLGPVAKRLERLAQEGG